MGWNRSPQRSTPVMIEINVNSGAEGAPHQRFIGADRGMGLGANEGFILDQAGNAGGVYVGRQRT